MPATPTVAVVMTAHNSELFIAAALASLQLQTRGDWECVIVDDGSTDSTAEIVSRFAARDTRLRLIRQEQSGVSHARNVGLAAVTEGVPYLALLDSDDSYLPTALARLIDAIERRPDAVGVFGLAEYMNEAGQPVRLGEHPSTQLARRVVRGIGLADVAADADTTFADLSVSGAIWPAAVALHRREVVRAVGAFDASFTRQGDWELYLRMSRLGPFAVVTQQVAWYRRHGFNLTGDTVESRYQQQRVRRKAYVATSNSRRQRQLVAQAARRIKLVDVRRGCRALAADLAGHRWATVRGDVVGLAVVAGTLVRPGPSRASRRRARFSHA